MNHRNGFFFLLFLALCVSAFAEDTVHEVVRGETIYSLARTYNISQTELMQMNNIDDPAKLKIGQRLRIPGSAAGSTATGSSTSVTASTGSTVTVSAQSVTYIEHRVVKDETLYGIARKYGVAVGVLLEANNISLDHVLWVGERIRVPQQADSTGTSKLTVAPAPVPAADPRATTAKPVDTSLRWPVTAKEIAYMTGKLSGVMVTGERAESVKSLTQGTVVSAGPYRGFGRVAIIQATGGYLYVYGGCESLSVKEGDRVAPGTELGKLGIDAVTEKPQLFFLVYRNNVPVDPSKAPRA